MTGNSGNTGKEQKIDSVLEAIQIIQRRLDSAPVLNGGFAKLVSSVEQIQKEQEKITKRYDELDETLYKPEIGYFAKTNYNEKAITLVSEELHNEKAEFVKKIDKVSESVQEVIKQADENKNEITKIKEASGGDTYPTLNALSQMKKRTDKFSWLLVAAIMSPLLQFIWSLITKK